MRKDIHSALLSVGEVAFFAFSLLELLLTRILPLAGFLAAHLLLHFCHLLAAIVGFASAGRRKQLPRGEDWQDYEYEESWNEHKRKDRQLITVSSDEADFVLLRGAMSATQVADAVAEIADHPHVAGSTPSDIQIIDSSPSDLPAADDADDGAMSSTSTQAAAQAGDYHLHVAGPETRTTRSNPPALNGVKAAAHSDVQALVYESGPFDLGGNSDVPVGGDQPHVANPESSDRQNNINNGFGSSDGQVPSEEVSQSTSNAHHESMRRDGSRKIRSSMRSDAAAHMQIRVLPPSLSQIKRTLMQRSRRSSPHQSKSPYVKPAIKKQSPRPRKLASSALKSSASIGNFMSQFRKHFLIADSA